MTPLAQGETPGLFLLDAGRTSDGILLTRVLDARGPGNGSLHPAYPLDSYGWEHWHLTDPHQVEVLDIDQAETVDANPVLAVRQGGDILLNAGFDGRGAQLARVFSPQRGIVSTSYNADSLLRGSGWADIDSEAAQPVASQAAGATWHGLTKDPPLLLPFREPADLDQVTRDRVAAFRSR